MEPTTTATIIIAVIGLISGVIAHIRFHSRCHIGDVLEMSVSVKKEEKEEKEENTDSIESAEEL